MEETESHSSALDAKLAGVDTRPLRQQIADVLTEAIVDGEYRPGEALVETEIANRLGVSRAPVREALQLLATTSLVEAVPYRGTTVRQLTRTDIEELYTMRTVLETFALRCVMRDDPRAAADELRAICDRMQVSAARGDWHRLAADDHRFHEALIAGAGNSLLREIWGQLDVRVRQIVALRNMQNDDSMQIFYNHVPIVEAIAAGDEASAVRHLEEHIASAVDLVVDDVEAAPDDVESGGDVWSS